MRVGRRGLEPLTPCASCKCATNCANGPEGENPTTGVNLPHAPVELVTRRLGTAAPCTLASVSQHKETSAHRPDAGTTKGCRQPAPGPRATTSSGSPWTATPSCRTPSNPTWSTRSTRPCSSSSATSTRPRHQPLRRAAHHPHLQPAGARHAPSSRSRSTPTCCPSSKACSIRASSSRRSPPSPSDPTSRPSRSTPTTS